MTKLRFDLRDLNGQSRYNSADLLSSIDLTRARRWASQAKLAILKNCSYVNAVRVTFSNLLVHQLMQEMPLIWSANTEVSETTHEVMIFLRDKLISPAIELQDDIICAFDKFTIGTNNYKHSDQSDTSDFYDNLQNLDCKNVGKGPRRFRPDKMKPKPTNEDIRNNLRQICPTTPSLVLRETNNNDFGPPITLVKQEFLVAWDHPETPTLSVEERGFFWYLYRSCSSRSPPGVSESAAVLPLRFSQMTLCSESFGSWLVDQDSELPGLPDKQD